MGGGGNRQRTAAKKTQGEVERTAVQTNNTAPAPATPANQMPNQTGDDDAATPTGALTQQQVQQLRKELETVKKQNDALRASAAAQATLPAEKDPNDPVEREKRIRGLVARAASGAGVPFSTAIRGPVDAREEEARQIAQIELNNMYDDPKRPIDYKALATIIPEPKYGDETLARMLARKELRERIREKYPSRYFGQKRTFVPRYTAGGIAEYGETAAKASYAQLSNRARDGWTGHGAYIGAENSFVSGNTQFYRPMPQTGITISPTGYSGEGSFWSSLWGGIKSVGSAIAPVLGTVANVAIPALVKIGVDRFAPGSGDAVAQVASSITQPIIGKMLGSGKYESMAAEYFPDLTYVEETEFLASILRKLLSHPAGVDLIRRVHAASNSDFHMDDSTVYNKRIQMQPLQITAMPPNKETPYGNSQFMANNLVDPGMKHSRTNPQISTVQDETGDLVFSYREYVKDITSSSLNFSTVEKFELNPGIAYSFPLLSSFAQYFEEYDFEQLIFHFKSLVTDGNAAAAGSVMIVPIYNPSSNVLPDKRSCENTDQCVSGKVTADLICGVECANEKKALGGYLYTRTDDVPRDQRRTYDLGFVQVALQGVPANLHIGELWVEYRVRLSKLRVTTVSAIPMGNGFTINAGSGNSGTSAATNQYFWNPASSVPVQWPVGNIFSDLVGTNLSGDALNLGFMGSAGGAVTIAQKLTSLSIGFDTGDPATPWLDRTTIRAVLSVTTGQRYRIFLQGGITMPSSTGFSINKAWFDSTNASTVPLSLAITDVGNTPLTTVATVPFRITTVSQRTTPRSPNPTQPPNNATVVAGVIVPYLEYRTVIEIEITQQQFQQTGTMNLVLSVGANPAWWTNGSTISTAPITHAGTPVLGFVRVPY